MPSIINSDDGVVSGTSGLKSTGGNDGLLNIQSNGSTVVAVTGSGISVTGTVSQTGVSTFAAGTVSAPSITFTGDTNTGIFSPAADTIAFTEGGAEAMRIDSSGRVGIGVSSPTWRLEVAGNNGSEFKVSRGTNEFGVSLINNAGGVVYVGAVADSPLALMTNATERMRLNSSGTVILQGGSTSATGVGITFPATQSASSDANTLDDYEEGTFTPTVLGSSTAGTSTYTIQNGAYTKVGRSVIFRLRVAISAATGTGNLQIGGLPFSSADQTGVSIGFANVLALGANNVATAFASGSVIEIYQYPIGGGPGTTVGMDTAFDIMIAGVYQT